MALSFRNANLSIFRRGDVSLLLQNSLSAGGYARAAAGNDEHPSFGHLTLLVFEAVMEVVCVSLPGYLVAKIGMFDAENQKFVANLNVMLFTPCLVFTKLASQLTAEKLSDLAVVPVIFIMQTFVSYYCAVIVSKAFRFRKRQSNFVQAMAVFGNSNSLPISLVLSLSKTLTGLHWDQVPNDNDDEVAARGILYLLIFQQLGQLLRWSWGYRVLLAPREYFYRDEEERARPTGLEDNIQEPYSDEPYRSAAPTVVGTGSRDSHGDSPCITPVTDRQYVCPKITSENGETGSRRSTSDPENGSLPQQMPILSLPPGEFRPHESANGAITSFPDVEVRNDEEANLSWRDRVKMGILGQYRQFEERISNIASASFSHLPPFVRCSLKFTYRGTRRFLHGLWEFMSPPLWSMLIAVLVASVPSLQRVFFTPGTFINNSVTRAVSQSGGVAVPLILVVLGANLARNTLPKETLDEDDFEHPKEERNLIIASLLSRMLLPTMVMGPILALMAKFVPISILDDPIFVIVCFLITGAPTALQLAQICQLNNVFMGAMSALLFQSYVIWILPSTLMLVMCALEVVKWASDS